LIAANGTTQIVTGTTLATSALTITPTTIRDKTECPGDFCPYQGSDLYIDATHLCQQRTSGAKNWEAWIKDSRDNELYRIVKMPDNKWWLAQNVKLATYGGKTIGSAISGCTKDECGRGYTSADICASYAGGTSGTSGNVQGICPPNWLLPIRSDYTTLLSNIGSTAAVTSSLRALNSYCTPINDTYGWASKIGVNDGWVSQKVNESYVNENQGTVVLSLDWSRTCGYACSCYEIVENGAGSYAQVRCIRAL
jgi:uncharacterized protein (TIGR02145 family)